MTTPNHIERRDPCSPVLRLGAALSSARRHRHSGWIRINEKNHSHYIQVNDGAISNIVKDGIQADPRTIHEQAISLFSLPRPHVTWLPDQSPCLSPRLVDPSRVVLSGVTARQDLFDPRILVQRIPVQSLHIKQEFLPKLKHLPLSRVELEFLYQLRIPTPIPMILWKRGFDPKYAGSLIVALNIMGLWQDQWEPGLLPRLTAAVRVLKKVELGAEDYEILGIAKNSTEEEQDKAFRRLSLELHPDRIQQMPTKEIIMAQKAFEKVNTAYHNIKRSRRKRPVRNDSATTIGKINLIKKRPDNWASMLQQARWAAERGDLKTMKSFALKALNLTPPPGARREISQLLKKVA